MALKMQSPLDRVNDVKQLYPNDTTSTLSFDGFVTTENEIYRTIIKNEYDTRVCKIFQKKNEITVFPGKIDHIFYAYDKIKKCLKKS